MEQSLKLQTHTETIRYIESEDTVMLKSKSEQLHSTNLALQTNVNILKTENHQKTDHIQDLERRVSILEDTNLSLEQELRNAIDSKKTASRVSQNKIQEEKSLMETVLVLKSELREVRGFSQLVRQENDELYSQLDLARSNRGNHQHTKPVKNGRSRSRSPISHLSKMSK